MSLYGFHVNKQFHITHNSSFTVILLYIKNVSWGVLLLFVEESSSQCKCCSLTVDLPFSPWLPLSSILCFSSGILLQYVWVHFMYYVWYMKRCTNHQGNADQNHNTTLFHICQNCYQKYKKLVNAGEDVVEREPLCNGWKINQPLWKTLCCFLKLHVKLPYNPTI